MTIPRATCALILSGVLAISAAPGTAHAQDADAAGRLAIELNAAETTEEGCSLSFLIVNGLPEAIDSLVLEAVLFDATGQVDRLTLFDFGALPVARPRVRQFVLPDSACEAFGSILINGAETCEAGGAALTTCEEAFDLRTRAGIELIG